jgi:uncharacterized protein YpmS
MQTKTIKLPQYKHIFFTLIALSVLSIIVYVYAVNQTVRNVVMRQKMEAELTHLVAQNGETEFAYIARKNAITLATASELGFTVVDTSIFVSRQSSVALADKVTSSR